MRHKQKANLKIGVIGCGNIARVHLRYITKYIDAERVALCDRDRLRLEDLAVKTGIKNTFNDLGDMLNHFHPDIVHILTPPTTHKDIAIKCLDGGSHLLIEKPMCLSTQEADEIIEKAKEKNKLVCVDHMRLFDPLFLEVKKVLLSGRLGNIVNVSVSYSYDFLERTNTDAASRWISDLPGGAFFDLMPHSLCLLTAFLHDIEVKNSAYWRNKDNIITDLWSVFSSPDGTGSLHMSLKVFPLKNYVLFECTKGVLTIDFRNFLLLLRKQYNLPNAVERIVENLSIGMQTFSGTIGTVCKFIRGRLDPYAGLDNIMKDFYTAVVTGGRSPVSPQEARFLLELTEKIFPQSKEKDISGPQKKKLIKADALVTGGTGFIGRRLVNRLLEDGNKVRVLTHRKISDDELKSLFCSQVDLVCADIYNYSKLKEACKDVHIVYHLAAAMKGDWNYHLDTTITGTRNVIEAAQKTNVEHIVYVSTLNVYNAKAYPKNTFINEDFPYEEMPEKRGAYSNAKLKAEKIVREYANNKKTSITILRPGLVYGPGGKSFLQDAGYMIGKSAVLVLGMGGRRLPLVYIDNAVEAIVLAGQMRQGGIFNIVDSDYPTQREFIRLYKKLTGENIFVIYIPLWVFMLGFWMVEHIVRIVFKKSISLRYKLRCISRNVKHSAKRAAKVLGWCPRVRFEEGLRIIIQENIQNHSKG